jgi:2-dehydropantoate 2-reductase
MFEKIAILGVGAIGSSIGADLTDAGYDVDLIDQWPDHVNTMKANGLRIKMPDLDLKIPVKAYHLHELYTQQPKYDLVILASKSYDNEWLVNFIKPYLKSNGVLLAMQNGLNDEGIASLIGYQKAMGCVVELSAELVEPGYVVRNTTRTTTWLSPGELTGLRTSRLQGVEDLLSKCATAKKTSNIWGAKWSKLISNTMTQGPIGMLGIKSFEAGQLPGFFELALEVGKETYEVGRAMGIEIEPIFGLNQEDFNGNSTDIINKLLHTLLKHLGKNSRNAVVQDHAKGRKTEVAYLNGLVVNKGAMLNIKTPYNASLCKVNALIESKQFSANPSNLNLIQTYL